MCLFLQERFALGTYGYLWQISEHGKTHTHTWLTLIRTLPISTPTEVNKGNPRQRILLTNELPGKPRTIAYHLHNKSVKTNVDSVPKGTDEEIFWVLVIRVVEWGTRLTDI